MSQPIADRKQIISKLEELISELRVGVLNVQNTNNEFRGCPMMTVDAAFDGDLWFFIGPEWPLRDMVQNGNQVGVTYACPKSHRYVSISGVASVVTDAKKIETLWDDSLSQWVASAQADDEHSAKRPANVSLLKVSVERAEYWDVQSGRLSKMLDYVKSLFTTEDSDSTEHEQIAWSPSKTS